MLLILLTMQKVPEIWYCTCIGYALYVLYMLDISCSKFPSQYLQISVVVFFKVSKSPLDFNLQEICVQLSGILFSK